MVNEYVIFHFINNRDDLNSLNCNAGYYYFLEFKLKHTSRCFSYSGTLQGRPQELGGGGAKFFFQIWEFAMRIARGVRGHAPPRNFFKTMQFGAF